MGRVFFHGTGDSDYGFDNMIKIIETGGIKSLSYLNSEFNGAFNGRDYISVCAWDEKVNHTVQSLESAFAGWIFGCPCFIISGDIEAVKCDKYTGSYNSNIDRVSQYKDEWHVKDYISLNDIIGIALPLDDIEFIKRNKEKVDKILEYANKYNWPVFNSDDSLIENTKSLVKDSMRKGG